MIAKRLQWDCVNGPGETVRERWSTVASILGATLVLTSAWMWVAVTYRDPQIRQHVLAFSQLPFLAALILTMPRRSLKGRPRTMQVLLVSGAFFAVVAWCLLVGFVASAL